MKKIVMRLAYIILGFYAGIQFLSIQWTPLLRSTPNAEISHHEDSRYAFRNVQDPDKRMFFITIYGTFESENPRSEMLDSYFTYRPSDEEKNYYATFNKRLNKLTATGCPTKEIVVPTRWADIEAIDRKLQVFDLENCQ